MTKRQIETVVAQNRLQTSLRHNSPYVSNIHLKVDDKILIYRERENNHWAGPYKISKIDDKQVEDEKSRTIAQFPINQVRPCVRNML